MTPLKPDQTKRGLVGQDAPLAPPATPPDRPRVRPAPTFESGLGAILLIDALALLLVIASGPAAYLWLDSTHPSPIVATATPGLAGSPPPASGIAPAASASSLPGVPSGPASSSGASPKLVAGDGTWARADSLPQPTWATASVVLHDGRVMVLGGATAQSSFDAVASATIFDPRSGLWSAATDMLQARAYPMAVTLADGSVLVAGGSHNGQPLDTAERYYPDNGTWVAAGRLNIPRTQGALTLLKDGRVLATGGGIEAGPDWNATASAEIYDPARGTWSIVAPMAVARARQTATLLPDGEVLVAGGATTFHGEAGIVTAKAEIFNPGANSWRPAASMLKPRYTDAATLLSDGRVLVAGGWYATSSSDPSHNTAEIYDPTANTWTATGSMVSARADYSLVKLADGRVLAAGGVNPAYTVQASSEIYDPSTGAWAATGDLLVGTMWPAAGLLPDGRVLIAGGALDALAAHLTAACQIYAPTLR
ncbi:MAG: Kelch repeat-containing protein [Candidatus Limnocylindrales bacterium]